MDAEIKSSKQDEAEDEGEDMVCLPAPGGESARCTKPMTDCGMESSDNGGYGWRVEKRLPE